MIRLGTRGSQLALTQSRWVADQITRVSGEPVELIVIRTEGDNTAIPLDAPSRPGAFVATLRDALLDGRVQVAVHSFKDLPSAQPDGLVIAAVPPREDPRDVLISRDGLALAELPAGARVGTSSPRRAAAVRRARPDAQIVPIRGNVDTRVGFVASGRVDAVVLAAAGLTRLGRSAEISHHLDAEQFLPAPAQGALAVECRADDPVAKIIAELDDHHARALVTAERAVLVGMDAACTTALGAHATLIDSQLSLTAEIADHGGVDHARVERVIDFQQIDLEAARRLGLAVAADLLGS